MVAKSLNKLIDEAIVPAIILIVAKMLGLFAISYFLRLNFVVQNGEILRILPSLHFQNLQDYIVAENYSNAAMFAVAAIGTMYVLVRAHYFHESHIHPTLQAKLVAMNLENLIAPSYHLYHQAAIWIFFLWLVVAFLILSSILAITYPYLAFIAFVIAANFSWVFAVDIEREIEINQEA